MNIKTSPEGQPAFPVKDVIYIFVAWGVRQRQRFILGNIEIFNGCFFFLIWSSEHSQMSNNQSLASLVDGALLFLNKGSGEEDTDAVVVAAATDHESLEEEVS